MTTRTRTIGTTKIARRKGFTLIELLIVVVIIGILAALAIPKFANTKQRATVSSMRSDLRNLATIQEGYWSQNRIYYGGVIPDPALQYNVSQGVTVTIEHATDVGWSARATAVPLTTMECVIFYGTAPAIPPATVDGAVACS